LPLPTGAIGLVRSRLTTMVVRNNHSRRRGLSTKGRVHPEQNVLLRWALPVKTQDGNLDSSSHERLKYRSIRCASLVIDYEGQDDFRHLRDTFIPSFIFLQTKSFPPIVSIAYPSLSDWARGSFTPFSRIGKVKLAEHNRI
jgi:hypothetical protein